MRIHVRFVDGVGTAPLDLTVSLCSDATVGELADHLAALTGGDQGATVVSRWPEDQVGNPPPRERLISDAGPRSGSTVQLAAAPADGPESLVRAPVTLRTAGDSAIDLHYGTNDFGGAVIDVDRRIEVRSTGDTTATLNGERVLGSTRAGPGDLVGASGHLGVIEMSGALRPPPARGPAVAHAAEPFRPDRHVPTAIHLPDPPASVRVPGFPVLSAMVPLLMGGGLWIATRSVASALFVLFSFVFVVASGIEARRETRAEMRFRVAEFRDDLADAIEHIDATRSAEARRRRRLAPSSTEASEIARGHGPRLWERSATTDGSSPPMLVTLGTASLPAADRIVVPEQGRRDLRRELSTLAADRERHDLPVTVDLDQHAGVALVGPDESPTAVARALVIQLAALIDPTDLRIETLTSPDRSSLWSWCAWLPHDSAHHDTGAVANRTVLIVDGADDIEIAAALERSSSVCAVVWLSAAAAGIPAGIDAVLTVSGGRGRFESAQGSVPDVVVDDLTEDEAVPIARRLTPVTTGGTSVRLGAVTGEPVGRGPLPPEVSLRDVIADPSLLDDARALAARWSLSAASHELGAPVGVAGSGVVNLDLRLDGPHALIAGTTGAGKSELLRTLIASLALHHGPDRLTFLLVDYKGGAAFRSLTSIPHCVGLVTDLTDSLAARALISLRAEIRRREQIVADHDVTELVDLPGDVAPPALVVVVDEFAALARELPEFVDGLVDIAQRGRSLGVHLILATQRPAGVVTDSIRANTALRICLRVADEDDSRDVVDVPDAAHLSRGRPGTAVLRAGPSRTVSVQVAWAGGGGGREERITSNSLYGRATPPPAPSLGTGESTQLDLAVARTIEAARVAGLEPPRRPWVDPLPESIRLNEVASHVGPGAAVIGVVDRPERQRREPLVVDLDHDGGVLVLGASGSGRTGALRTIAAAFASHHSEPVHLHAIDSGNGLEPLRTASAVGDVVRIDEVERVARLIRTTHADMVERIGSGRGGIRRLLLVDGFAALEELYERVNRGELMDLVYRIARDGRAVGIHLVVAAQRRGELPAGLAGTLGCRIDLRCATEDDAALLGLTAGAASRDLPPGRAHVHHELAQIAFAGVDSDLASRHWSTPPASPVPRLPALAPASGAADGWSIPIGIDADHLTPASLDLTHHHAIVAGPPRSGRSTALDVIGHAFGSGFLLTSRSAPRPTERWSEVAGGEHAAESLGAFVDAATAAARSGAPSLVAVDDLPELLDGPDEAEIESLLLGLIGAARSLPIRLVVSGDIDALARCYGELLGALRSGRTGILLQPDPDLHAGLLHASLGVREDLPPAPGRGWLVAPSSARPCQVAHL